MSRTLLPPRGIFVPVDLLFDRALPSAIRDTWAQLRALAWGLQETPALSLEQIGKITGKRPSTIYQHMAALRNRNALRWRTSERGTVIVSFPEEFTAEKEIEPVIRSDQGCTGSRNLGIVSGNTENLSRIPEKFSRNPENFSENPELPYHSSSSSYDNLSPCISLNQTRKNAWGEKMEEEEEGKFRKSGNDLRSLEPVKITGAAPGSAQSQLAAGAAQVYRRTTGLSPNRAQRASIAGAVTDLVLWQSTVEHWMAHGWNPRNLPALLDFYSRGGPAACQSCQKPSSPGARQSTYEASLAALEKFRRELHGGER